MPRCFPGRFPGFFPGCFPGCFPGYFLCCFPFPCCNPPVSFFRDYHTLFSRKMVAVSATFARSKPPPLHSAVRGWFHVREACASAAHIFRARSCVLRAGLVLFFCIDGIAPGETIRSVRYIGQYGYVVTFERTDPLFVIDF
ncbi:MAG: beta-propeller domain-containing protein, partial [Clostridium sp.]|nr:beta-propeller domain-containing protein [Clostridium sp.]